MARNKQTDEKTQTEVQEEVQETKYPRQDFIDHAEAIFGVKPEVVIGALHDNEAAELTKTEVKKAIDDFLNRKVK
jgi:hypothetical protein